MKDFQTLKAWCHWKKLEKDLSEDDQLFVKDISDLISLNGTLRTENERLHTIVEEWKESRDPANEHGDGRSDTIGFITFESHQKRVLELETQLHNLTLLNEQLASELNALEGCNP